MIRELEWWSFPPKLGKSVYEMPSIILLLDVLEVYRELEIVRHAYWNKITLIVILNINIKLKLFGGIIILNRSNTLCTLLSTGLIFSMYID